jgi:quercetin dioxygenase-like cupin family protein
METSTCTVVRPGASDAYWLVTELLEPQLQSKDMDVVHVTASPSGGPPPHRHSREDEMFYVLKGKFEFVHNNTHQLLGAGEAVFLPRGSIHTYDNVGDANGRLLVVTRPGGFARFVASTGNICLDRSKVPQIGPAALEKLAQGCALAGIELLPAHKADDPAPSRARPQEVWCLGLHVRLLLTSEQTQGQFSVAEILAEPGLFVPPHTHDREDEFFYVTEGEFEFNLADGVISAPAGTFVHVPKQTVHGFRNASGKTAKLFDVHTPGGFERFFIASGTPCLDIKLGPPKTKPDMQRFVEICRQHGMELAG